MFTPAIVDLMVERLADVRGTVLDPFAGPGLSLHRFVGPRRRVIGFEIEEPWVDYGNRAEAKRTAISSNGLVPEPMLRCVDSTKMPLRAKSIAAIITSPVYGNRMSDHHHARDASERRSYTHDIRTMTGDDEYELDENNVGQMSYGYKYQHLQRRVYAECLRVIKPGGPFLLNVSDFIRDGQRVDASVWHVATCVALGWEWRDATRVQTPRMRRGQNHAARVDGEWVIELRKPA